MWFCFKNAFLSVVHKDCKPDELLVRARVAGHIEAVFPHAKVRKTYRTDYLFRAVVKREEVGRVLTEVAMAYAAPNFKNSVKNDALHTAYNGVWGVMARLQETQPYADGPRVVPKARQRKLPAFENPVCPDDQMDYQHRIG